MARFNEILVGSYNRYLQKHLGMKGPPVAPQLASEVQPVISFLPGKENDYLLGWQHFGNAVAIGAQGAGNISAMRLRNPAGSGVIAVVYQMVFEDRVNLNVGDWRISESRPNAVIAGILADLAAPNNPAFLSEDGRNSIGSVCSLSTGNGGAVGYPIVAWWGSTNAQTPPFHMEPPVTTEDQKYVLTPGDTLTMWSNITNNSCRMSMRWKERMLEESERT